MKLPTLSRKKIPTIAINTKPLYEFKYIESGNNDFRFSLITENNQILTTPFQCKDYLNDIFYSELNNIPVTVYGIKWTPGQIDVSVNEFRILIFTPRANLQLMAKNMISFINKFEDILKIPRSTYAHADVENGIVIIFSRMWIENTRMISTFATLIRLSGDYNPTESIDDYFDRILNTNSLYKFPSFMTPELVRKKDLIKKFRYMLLGNKPEDNIEKKVTSPYTIHEMGLFNLKNFPPQEAEEV